MTVLAIDQGTTSTRGMVLDDRGTARIVRVIEHKQFYPEPGWVEHDPEELIQNIRSCIEACTDISAIGIANQGESCLAWDADTGEAISPVIVWQDNRTHLAIEELKANGAQSLVQDRTGLPLSAYFSASKLAWIVQNIPQAKELLKKGRLRLGTTDAFFLDRLGGTFVTDITTASRTCLMNLETGQWDPELCAVFGVPIQALPQIVPTTGDFGTVESHGKRIPITASIVDQQASLYGHGCAEGGDAKITFGTGAFALMVTGDECLRAPGQGLLPTIAWHLDGAAPVYALEGGVHCAGSALNWARSLGLFSDFSELNHFDAAPAITRKLVFVPALTGLACPHWDTSAAGLWIGLSLDTTPRDMVQAVIEGIALRVAEVVSALNDYAPVSSPLSIDGGMASNPYFCQFLSTVLQRDVQVPELGELTAYGTAMLAKGGQRAALNQQVACGKDSFYRPALITDDYQEKFSDAVNRSKGWS
ncbi:glycerol kinase [Hoeflea sp. IMCC20628]|uniref:FGGY family carbohydrate kinase n=1 Tax=Hoeflea sp. IMCC20628 TaxID=1620421 RepID=UPI00063AE39F|nr:FGGY family carbohydrate kinase [Hoeflea sp. IMCC20628]AKI00537.1 glycerol kinase [Hoeflea sp. IMCC20628]